jgi:hypothetical protein
VGVEGRLVTHNLRCAEPSSSSLLQMAAATIPRYLTNYEAIGECQVARRFGEAIELSLRLALRVTWRCPPSSVSMGTMRAGIPCGIAKLSQ